MADQQIDPLSPQGLKDSNTYTQAVRDRIAYLLRSGAQFVGNTLLNSGAPNDATAAGQEARRRQAEDKAINYRP